MALAIDPLLDYWRWVRHASGPEAFRHKKPRGL